MATQQVILNRQGNIGSGITSTFAALAAGIINSGWNTTESSVQQVWYTPGTLKNLYVKLGGALSPTSSVFKVRINGADTGITCTINNGETTAFDSTHTTTIATGDTVTLECDITGTGGVTDPQWAIEFIANSGNGVSCYGNAISALSAAAATYAPLPFGNYRTTTSSNEGLAGAAGTIPGYRVKLSGNPGTGKSYEFAIYKNGTKQDGSAGTPDTRITISDAATTGSTTFNLTVAAGDRLRLQVAPTGTPTVVNATHSFQFNATTDGDFLFGGGDQGAIQTAAPSYNAIVDNGLNYSSTEANETLTFGISTVSIKSIYVRASNTNTNLNYTVRKNAGDTNITCNLTGVTTGNDTSHTASYGTGDTIDVKLSGTPGFNRSAVYGFAANNKATGRGGGAGKGNSGNKKGGGGAIHTIYPNGAYTMNIGNPGLDIGST